MTTYYNRRKRRPFYIPPREVKPGEHDRCHYCGEFLYVGGQRIHDPATCPARQDIKRSDLATP